MADLSTFLDWDVLECFQALYADVGSCPSVYVFLERLREELVPIGSGVLARDALELVRQNGKPLEYHIKEFKGRSNLVPFMDEEKVSARGSRLRLEISRNTNICH